MKRWLILSLVLLSLLFSLGCDRFKHAFEPPDTVDFAAELFTPLDTAFHGFPSFSLDPVMAFYAEDYLHYGQTKADRRNWLQGIFDAEPNALGQVTLINAEELTDSTAIANWRLKIETSDRVVLADSLFSGERLVKRGGKWLLKGNQMTCVLPTPKQQVIVEYFTFYGCPNCPVVEAELHDLEIQYSGQMSYLEHHVSGPLMIGTDPTYLYYGPFTVPTSIFQGTSRLTGSGTDVIDSYAPLVQSLAAEDSDFRYINPTLGVEGNTVSGSLSLEQLATDIDYTDLVLNYVLIERVSSFNNTQGQPLRNVVRAKGYRSLTEADLNQPVLFTLESTVAIPDDAALVIFVQNRPSPYANNATIHGGVEVDLNPAVISFQ